MLTSTMNIISSEIKDIIKHYGFNTNTTKISPLGNGHINTTLLVSDTSGDGKNKKVKTVVLQKINHSVFTKPQQIIKNADLISQHITKLPNYPLHNIVQLKTINGESSCHYGNNTWRALRFIEHSCTVEQLETVQQAKQVATAFAQFTDSLKDFDAETLDVVIPDFHDLAVRIEQLQIAFKNCKNTNRLNAGKAWINFCEQQQGFINTVADISKNLPLRVMHNDTKIGNLLFSSKTQQPIAVIDLDTCMPGFLMNDFGDMVRTTCSSLSEDATDVENMTIKEDIYQALLSSYSNTLASSISKVELESLPIGAKLLPFIIAIRFLTDYLNEDIYFQTKHPQHNLDRAINQFTLYKLMNNYL